MTGRYGAAWLLSMALATSLAGGIAATATASAQEAITLEVIGAVRMARPDAAGMVTGRKKARSPAQANSQRGERDAIAR